MLTGGAGYIGSHTCVALIKAGYETVVFDDFSNSNPGVLNRIQRLTGVCPPAVKADICDRDALARALQNERPDAVIHLAGRKSVPESIQKPLTYSEANVGGAAALVRAMAEVGVQRLVFASSAAVYGKPVYVPVTEDHPLQPSNPYGQSKMVAEQMLDGLVESSDKFRIAILRFFNPVGAHESGLIGEDPRGEPGNLMPYLSQVAIGRRPHLNIFGKDYDTVDGTTVRDYVHIMDIAAAHIRALECLETQRSIKVNLGTGQGHSILELVNAFSKVSDRDIVRIFVPRREGDVAQCYASVDLAQKRLAWRAERSLTDMCGDAWRWQRENPQGYSNMG